MGAKQASPFRGIHAFGFRDHALFFGREAVVQDMLVKVMLARLVVLYGETGSGKSSMLNAGLVSALRKEGYQPHRLLIEPGGPVMVEQIEAEEPGTWLPSIFPGAQGSSAASPTRAACSLDLLAQRVREAGPKVRPALIFDQFEQLFTLFGRERQADQARILEAIHRLIDDETLRVKVVIALREDFLGKLEVLAKQYPRAFDNRVRLLQMSCEDALDAILNPFLQEGFNFGSRIKRDLAHRIVEDLRKEGDSDLVHPTKLQIVCSRLWDAHAHKPEITLANYDDMGGCEGILRGYLESELATQTPQGRVHLTRVMSHLVSEAGTRDIVSGGKLKSLLVRPGTMLAGELDAALASLVALRLVNATPRNESTYYEIASEYLIPPLMVEMEKLRLEEQRAEAALQEAAQAEAKIIAAKLKAGRKFKAVSVLLLLMTITASVLGWQFWTQKKASDRNASEAHELADLAKRNSAIANEQAALARAQTEIAEEQRIRADERTAFAEQQEAEARLQTGLATQARERAELAEKRQLASSLRARAAQQGGDPQLTLHLALASLQALDAVPASEPRLAGWRLEAEQAVRSNLQAAPILVGGGTRKSEVATFQLPAETRGTPAVSADGRWLAAIRGCNAVALWNLRLGLRMADLDIACEGERLSTLVLTRGRLLIVGSEGWEVVHLESGLRVRRSPAVDNSPQDAPAPGTQVGVSTDGRFIAFIDKSGAAAVQEIETGRAVWRARPRSTRPIAKLAITNNGETLAIATQDGAVDVHDQRADGRPRMASAGTGQVVALAFMPASSDAPQNLAVLYSTGRLRYVNNQVRQESWEAMHAQAVRIQGDGAGGVLTSTAAGEMKVWRERTGEPLRSEQLDGALLGWSRESTMAWQAVVQAGPLEVLVRDYRSAGFPRASVMALSADGRRLALATPGGAVEVYAARLARRIARGANDAVMQTALAFSADGQQLAVGSADGSVRVIKASTGQETIGLPANEEDAVVHSLLFTTDGSQLVTGDGCGGLRVWNVRTGVQASPFPSQDCDDIYVLATARGGKALVTGNESGKVVIHDFDSRSVLGEFKLGGTLQGAKVRDVLPARQLEWIAVLTAGGTVEVWEPRAGQWHKRLDINQLREDGGHIYAIARGAGDDTVLTLSRKGRVEEWPVVSGKEPRLLAKGLTTGQKALFGPGGNTVVVAPGTDVVRVYPLGVRQLVAHSLVRLGRPLSREECADYLLTRETRCTGTFESSNLAVKANAEATRGDLDAALNTYAALRSAGGQALAGVDAEVREMFAEALVANAGMLVRPDRDVPEVLESLRKAKRLHAPVVEDPARTSQDWAAGARRQMAKARVSFLIGRGDSLASEYGNTALATATYARALDIDPKAIAEPPAARAAARAVPYVIRESVRLVRGSKVLEGLKLFWSAWDGESKKAGYATELNSLCWLAALKGFAKDVAGGICEEAVHLRPTTAVYDSRGVARALAGQREQAIEDFARYASDSTRPAQRRQARQLWIDELKAGRDPFTPELLKALEEE